MWIPFEPEINRQIDAAFQNPKYFLIGLDHLQIKYDNSWSDWCVLCGRGRKNRKPSMINARTCEEMEVKRIETSVD